MFLLIYKISYLKFNIFRSQTRFPSTCFLLIFHLLKNWKDHFSLPRPLRPVFITAQSIRGKNVTYNWSVRGGSCRDVCDAHTIRVNSPVILQHFIMQSCSSNITHLHHYYTLLYTLYILYMTFYTGPV